MKIMNKLIVPVTASALLLGACGSNATDSESNTLISSKAGDVKVKDVMNKIGDEQIASTSFSIALNKILADKYKDKVDTKDIDDEIKKNKNNMVAKINLKVCLNSKVCLQMIIKNRKTCRISKQLLADKVKVSDKELKENTKKLLIF